MQIQEILQVPPVCLQQSRQVPGVPGRRSTYLQYREVYEGRTASYKVVYSRAVIVFSLWDSLLRE